MRHLLALLVSSCLASFLTSFLFFALSTGFVHPGYNWVKLEQFRPNLNLGFFYPVAFIGPIMFILAVLVLFLGCVKAYSKRSYLISFVILWCIWLAYLSYLAGMIVGVPEFLMIGIVPGAICGWVYWLIAIKNQPV